MPREYTGRKFSLPIFVIINTLSLAFLLTLLAFAAPDFWRTQLEAVWWAQLAAVCVAVFANAFVEFFFHRYVLHAPLVPFLSYFYRQHTLHHALTRVRMKRVVSSTEAGRVENIYPILEDPQHEASFFPWYTLVVLTGVLSPVYALVQWLLPSAPVFLGGIVGITCNMLMYEIFHMLEHKPLEKWLPLLEHPKYGAFWKQVYGFHLRHHANVLSNESVSGFFGLPIPDWVFGTYVRSETLYPHGSVAIPTTFTPPTPRFIGWLDELALRAKKRRPKSSVAQ